MKYFYLGIHKAASTWLISLLYDIGEYMRLNHEHFHSEKIFNYDLNKTIFNRNLDFISYTNADYRTIETLNLEFKGFHVIRDPRDMVVSSYFSHLNSHSDYMWPELNEYRRELKSLNVSDGLMATMKHLDNLIIDGCSVKIFENLKGWDFHNSNILELKFEDIVKNPYIIIPEVFEYLGLLNRGSKNRFRNTITENLVDLKQNLSVEMVNSKRQYIHLETLLHFIYKHDFYFKSQGRAKGQLKENSHYRKGLSGDWINYFNENHISHFKDNYGELLIKLNYEKNLDW
ncbi:MAG: hypothetical protein BM564_00020 [Bacteroidetes bacterium MedPE-SWsnd-G2]|nr:MAG: hypothetical protein BM564_00020 [Bacteroidetes bacterium MedPE-SWsnd-G2]